MSRYYDLDKLKELIEAKDDTLIKGKEAFLYVAKWLDLLPPADVVPKSEYDSVVSALDNSTKEFLKLHDDYQEAKSEIDKWKGRSINWYEVAYLKSQRILELEAELSKAKDEVARDIFAEIEKYKRSPMPECKPVYVINDSSFAELKKKYTEERT